MSQSIDEHWIRAARYLAGEMSREERRAFDHWLDSDPDRRKWLEDAQKTWDRTSLHQEPVDVDAAWQSLRRRMLQPVGREPLDRPPVRRRHGSYLIRFAFVVTAALGLITAIWWFTEGMTDNTTQMTQPRVIIAGKGERVNLNLRDGTSVELAPLSSLTIPHDFGESTRPVMLDGLAYFDVSNDPDRTFSVETARGTAIALGTKFTVRNYPEETEQFEVAVEEGSVRTIAGDASGILAAGQYSRLANDGLIVDQIVDPTVYFGWKDGNLAFREASIGYVATTIERWYGISIEIEDALMQHRLTANFTEDVPEDIMDVVALTISARLEREGDTFRLYTDNR